MNQKKIEQIEKPRNISSHLGLPWGHIGQFVAVQSFRQWVSAHVANMLVFSEIVIQQTHFLITLMQDLIRRDMVQFSFSFVLNE